MKVFLLSIFIAFFTFANASAGVGSVLQLKGNVKVKSEGSLKKSKIKSGFEIKAGDLISTSRKSSAVIKLSDGSNVVLDASSSVHFGSGTSVDQKSGKIYYKITSRDARNSLKVKTPFAIIGIKGTTFVVNATENASVTLKEGLIGVASIKEEFNLYRKKMEEEFNKFKSDMNADFEKFKSAQSGYLPPVKTKSFDLKEGNRISFSGQKVHEDAWNKDDDAEFSHFEALMDPNSTEHLNDNNISEDEVEDTNNSVETIQDLKKDEATNTKPIVEEKPAPKPIDKPVEVEEDSWDACPLDR